MLIRRAASVGQIAREAFARATSENRPAGSHCRGRSIVVSVGGETSSAAAARQLASSLGALGADTKYLGRQDDAEGIAALVAREDTDTVELCFAAGAGGVVLLRELVRRLIDMGRRDVSIVVHRVR